MGIRTGIVACGTVGLMVGTFSSCHNTSFLDSKSSVSTDPNSRFTEETISFVDQMVTPLERDSDKIFRDLFAWHLNREGFSQASISRAVFLTPEKFHQVPDTKNPTQFAAAMKEHFKDTVPSDWYQWGLDNPASLRQPVAPKKPVTVVVIPGIFGEFIKTFPFHEIVTNQQSAFFQKWNPAISKIQDEVYSLADLKVIPKPMSDLIKFGSYDIEGKPWVNVIVLQARLGSLETLGGLDTVLPAYMRRLNKIFNVIKDDSDLYILGYSRGGPVALELIARSVVRPDQQIWASKIKGTIGLGSVVYGTAVADEALDDPTSQNGKAIAILRNLVNQLQDRPTEGGGMPSRLNETKIVAQNTLAWQAALKQFLDLNVGAKSQSGLSVVEVFNQEAALRSQNESLQAPDFQGNLKYVFDFGTDLFKLDCPLACYFDNVKGFKILITKVIEGLGTLTVKSRMEWWQKTDFPQNIRMLSITGTMPDRIKNGELSPLFFSPFYGKGTVDFNKILRPAFYGNAAVDGTEINDSQVNNFNARYWPSMFPNRLNKSYYLGSMGTHHWGFSFPTAIENANGEINVFPRSALMAAIGSFIYQLDSLD